jgi:hypothetical protein
VIGSPTFSTQESGYQPQIQAAQLVQEPESNGITNFSLVLGVNQPGKILIGANVARLASFGSATCQINCVQAALSFSDKGQRIQPFTMPIALPGSNPTFGNTYNYFEPFAGPQAPGFPGLPLNPVSVFLSDLNFDDSLPAASNGLPRLLYAYTPTSQQTALAYLPMTLACGPTMEFKFWFDQVILNVNVQSSVVAGSYIGATLALLTL